MRSLLLLWALSGAPFIGVPATSRQADGTWKCSAACHTTGNDDGGSCHLPVVAHKSTEDACTADLREQCAKMKPPPGGCRWNGIGAK